MLGRVMVAAVLIAAAAGCWGQSYQPDVMIRAPGDSTYRGDGVFYTTRINQTRTQGVPSGGIATYQIRARNRGLLTDALTITGNAGDSSWTVTYYDALSGGSDVTAQVTGAGWTTSDLASGEYVELRAEVTPGPGVMQGMTYHVHVFGASQTDPTVADMVKAQTLVNTGATYYVSPNGNDANPGTFEAPWASPGYGSRQLSAGDTLVILGGRYVISQFDEDIMMPPSGTPEAWVTIRGEQGNRPVIAGRDNLFAAIVLGGRSYVRIQNLEITHDSTVGAPGLYFRSGIIITGSESTNIALQDLYIHHIDEGALDMQDVNHVDIVNCTFDYCGFGAIMGPAGEHGGCRNVFISGCELSYSGHYYRGGDGSDRPYDRPDGYGIEPSAGPIEIADTTAQHNYGDGLDSKSANTYVHNCIVANNSCDGIKLWQGGSRIVNCLVYGTGDGVGGPSPWAGIVIDEVSAPGAQFEIENVTVQDNPTRQAYPMYVQYGVGNPVTLIMRNTIISNGYGLVYIGPSVSFTCMNNLFYRPGASEQVEANGRVYTAAELSLLGPGNICAQPLYVDPAWGTTGDYHMLPGSPGINVGTSVGAPDVDLDYEPRPQGAGYDMGAYERP